MGGDIVQRVFLRTQLRIMLQQLQQSEIHRKSHPQIIGFLDDIESPHDITDHENYDDLVHI